MCKIFKVKIINKKMRTLPKINRGKKKTLDFLNLKNKKGMSEIITSMIMIGLVLVVIAIVWVVINNLIQDKVTSTQSCFGDFGAVTLNKQYTCLDSINKELQFSVSIGDADVSGVLISVSGPSATKSFTIEDGANYSYLKKYGGTYGGSLSTPGENSGVTYVADLTVMDVTDADTIRIAPIMDGEQCDVSDTILDLKSC